MVFRQFQDKRLSALGLGAMRLPVVGGDYAAVDEAAVSEIVDYAMEHGVNYYCLLYTSLGHLSASIDADYNTIFPGGCQPHSSTFPALLQPQGRKEHGRYRNRSQLSERERPKEQWIIRFFENIKTRKCLYL